MPASGDPDSLTLRPAQTDDARRIYEWRNDPWIVSLGTSGKTVTWQEHEKWLRAILADGKHLLFIIELAATGIGTVRFDLMPESRAVVTIYLLREFTGKGIGVRALEKASAMIFCRWPVSTIYAYVRADNKHSLAAFRKAGYTTTDASDCPPEHRALVLHRP